MGIDVPGLVLVDYRRFMFISGSSSRGVVRHRAQGYLASHSMRRMGQHCGVHKCELTPELGCRLDTLTRQLSGAMQHAAMRASGKQAAGQAAAAAFHANGDKAVSLGWAFVHQYAFDAFQKARASLPLIASCPLRPHCQPTCPIAALVVAPLRHPC